MSCKITTRAFQVLGSSTLLAAALAGCDNPAAPAVLGAVGVVTIAGQAPAQEVEQVYYLGVFDPQEQLPPAVYRVTVKGQASAFNQTKFASGWVPAAAIDNLNDSIGYSTENGLQLNAPAKPAKSTTAAPKAKPKPGEGENEHPADSAKPDESPEPSSEASSTAKTAQNSPIFKGRRLIMFGPEGFREAPKDHRLVIVMGSDPSEFFKAIGETFDGLAKAQATAKAERNDSDATRLILQQHLFMKEQQTELDRLDRSLKAGGGA